MVLLFVAFYSKKAHEFDIHLNGWKNCKASSVSFGLAVNIIAD